MSSIPYRLNYDTHAGRIYASGPVETLQLLERYPDAQRTAVMVALPAERAAFLAAEAVAAPVEVSGAYLTRRATVFQPTTIEINRLRFHLSLLPSEPTLAPHQRQFLAQALPNTAVLNASQQGTGKTRSALTLMQLWGARRSVILLPQSLAREWVAEWERMWHEERPLLFLHNFAEGKISDRTTAINNLAHIDAPMALLVNYEAVATMEGALKKFRPDCLVADESWRLKNRNTQVARAAKRIARKVREGTARMSGRHGRVLELTGTPIGNHIGDLYSQLDILGVSQETYWQFLETHAILEQQRIAGGRTVTKPVGVKNPAALMRMLEPVWFRATKATCLDLPEQVFDRVTLPLPAATQALYREVAKKGEAALGNDMSLAGAATVLMRLQQIAGGCRPTLDPESDTRCEYLPCPKIDWLKTFAKDRLEGDPTVRVIVWCRFNAEVARVTNELAALLGATRVREVTGATDTEWLDQIKASFNSRDEDGVQVIVAQIAKLAYGHNLQSGDWNLYFSHTWSYVERSQSEDRTHRMGRTCPVQYVDLVAEGTVDEAILEAVREKRDLAVRLGPDTIGKVVE